VVVVGAGGDRAMNDTMTSAEMAVARALGRGAIYGLLGAAFAYPLARRFQELAHGAATAAAAPTTPESLRPRLARFADAARDADPATVAAEYVILFDRQVRCPSYEGAYGAGRGLAGKGALLADVAGFYAAFGLRPAVQAPDTEDHVAAELEFMSALAVKEAWALGEDHAEGLAVTRAAQAAFLRDHLGAWAGAFAREVQAATPLLFYVAAAEVLAAWVDVEVAALGVEPASAAGPDAPAEEESFTCPMGPAPVEPGETDSSR
jgi:DMSO reductase family type II enzyme chaperone